MDIVFVTKQIDEIEQRLKVLKEYLSHIIEKSSRQKEDIVLFEKLRSLRNMIAREENVAPYCILHNSTLKEISNTYPSTLDELKNIKGFGGFKISKYGERIIMLVLEHINT